MRTHFLLQSFIVSSLLVSCARPRLAQHDKTSAELEREIIKFASQCLPTPGTNYREVMAIWDIPVEHSNVWKVDYRKIKVPYGDKRMPFEVKLMVHLEEASRGQERSQSEGEVRNLDFNDPKAWEELSSLMSGARSGMRVKDAKLSLLDIGYNSVEVTAVGVSLPKPLAEQRYLTLALERLQLLKQEIDRRKKGRSE